MNLIIVMLGQKKKIPAQQVHLSKQKPLKPEERKGWPPFFCCVLISLGFGVAPTQTHQLSM